jgi:hypothetical protein
MANKIQLRRDTQPNWYDENPILSEGEIAYNLTYNTFRIGDGTTAWRDLTDFVDLDAVTLAVGNAALTSTDDLSEGLENLYFENERVASALNSGTLNNITFTYSSAQNIIDVSVPTVQGTQGTQGASIQGVQGTTGTQGTLGTQGAQGTAGFVGSNGAQGTDGAQGTQGTDGTQGVQGTQGTQGVQGTDGAQGAVGSQGTQGVTGRDGNFGGATFAYSYETSFPNEVHEDFPNGILGFDNTTLTSATELFISFFDADSVSSEGFLQTIDDSDSAIKGNFKVYESSTPANYAFFAIIGAHDNGLDNHFHVPVAYISGSVTSFTDEDNLEITFARTGDTGDTGAQGTEGTQGTQGTDGTQGVQGTQGTQGVQGTLGTQGVQGTEGAQGAAGFVGSNGAQGTEGTQGTTGAQGTEGAQGVQGVQGTTGTQGIGGTNGTQGTQGTQGQVAADPTTTVLLFGGM